MEKNIKEFQEHFEKTYPILTDLRRVSSSSALLNSGKEGVIDFNDLYIGKKVISGVSTKNKTMFSLTKADFVEENANHVFSLFYRYTDSTRDESFTKLDFMEKEHKVIQNHFGDVNEDIKKGEELVYNIPIRLVNFTGISSYAVTRAEYKELCVAFENDRYIQKWCKDYCNSKMIKPSKDKKVKSISPDKIRKHFLKNYKELVFGSNIADNDKTIGINVGDIHLGKEMTSLTNTSGKTWFHTKKDEFVETKEAEPFSLFVWRHTGIGRYDSIIFDKDNKKHKSVSCLHEFFNENLKKDEKTIYNFPLTQISKKAVYAGVDILEEDFLRLTEKFEKDEFLQIVCKNYYENKFLTVKEHENKNTQNDAEIDN
jgi:hypothetical protein